VEKGDPILVKLRAHNAGKVTVAGICSFQLDDPTAGNDPFKEGRNLRAPVVVRAAGIKSAEAIPGEIVSSRLTPGEAIETEVDLNK